MFFLCISKCHLPPNYYYFIIDCLWVCLFRLLIAEFTRRTQHNFKFWYFSQGKRLLLFFCLKKRTKRVLKWTIIRVYVIIITRWWARKIGGRARCGSSVVSLCIFACRQDEQQFLTVPWNVMDTFACRMAWKGNASSYLIQLLLWICQRPPLASRRDSAPGAASASFSYG